MMIFRSCDVDHSYIEFNSSVIHSGHNDYDGLSITKSEIEICTATSRNIIMELFIADRYSTGSLSPTASST